MRKQYHFRQGAVGLDAWDVDRLIAIVENVAVEEIPVAAIVELDSPYWFDHGYLPTVRELVEHFRLMQDADPGYPIIVDPDGGVMDGMHRVARALLEGRQTIQAKRLPVMPEPDFRDCRPSELPY